ALWIVLLYKKKISNEDCKCGLYPLTFPFRRVTFGLPCQKNEDMESPFWEEQHEDYDARSCPLCLVWQTPSSCGRSIFFGCQVPRRDDAAQSGGLPNEIVQRQGRPSYRWHRRLVNEGGRVGLWLSSM